MFSLLLLIYYSFLLLRNFSHQSILARVISSVSQNGDFILKPKLVCIVLLTTLKYILYNLLGVSFPASLAHMPTTSAVPLALEPN